AATSREERRGSFANGHSCSFGHTVALEEPFEGVRHRLVRARWRGQANDRVAIGLGGGCRIFGSKEADHPSRGIVPVVCDFAAGREVCGQAVDAIRPGHDRPEMTEGLESLDLQSRAGDGEIDDESRLAVERLEIVNRSQWNHTGHAAPERVTDVAGQKELSLWNFPANSRPRQPGQT